LADFEASTEEDFVHRPEVMLKFLTVFEVWLHFMGRIFVVIW